MQLYKIFGYGVIAGYVLVAVVSLLVLTFVGISSYFHSTSCQAAYSALLQAYRDEKPEQASLYAKKFEKRAEKARNDKSFRKNRPMDPVPTEGDVAYVYSLASEINGDYEQALAFLNDVSKSTHPFSYARLLYKSGKKNEAFVEYCRIVDLFMSARYHKGKVEYCDLPQSERAYWVFTYFRRKITLEVDPYLTRLSSFETYADFLEFMQNEYQALGEPDDYAKQIAFLKEIDSKREFLDMYYAENKFSRGWPNQSEENVFCFD